MLSTIFKYEIKHWLKQPSTYIYALVFLLMAFGGIAGSAGFFDGPINSNGPVKFINSPVGVFKGFGLFKELILFLLPIIIGASLYRDFKSNAHAVLYSYPLSKPAYFFGKFLSAVAIVAGITLAIGIGFFVGTKLPGVDTRVIAPTDFSTYLQIYGLYLIPNILFFGGIVFAIVAYTRNIYSGFIAVLVLLAMQQIVGRIFVSMDNPFLFALFDPFGKAATDYYTHLWTVTEQNVSRLPFAGVIIYNRLLWLVLSGGIFLWTYNKFSFSQNALTLGLFRLSKKNAVAKNYRGHREGNIAKVVLPKVAYSFSFVEQLKSSWRLSTVDFSFIIKSSSFRVILVIGFLAVLAALAQMNPQHASKLLPVTWLMLLFPVFFFSMVINLLTFLYAGILVQRGKTAHMNQLVDVTPVSNWSLLLSKVLALVKMQIVLLFLILIAGIAVQTFNGYFHYEIGLYLFHLFVINLASFVIWAFLAVFVQTLFTNPYLGLFALILFSMGIGSLEHIGIEQAIFKYNQNPDEGFAMNYSDMSGYGAGLSTYLLYKVYWGLAGLTLLGGALMLWVRGLPHSFLERLKIARVRFTGKTAVIMISLLVCFVSLGFKIYYENNVVEKRITESQQRKINREADKKYGRYADSTQPRIVDVNLQMNIFSKSRSFVANGTYILVNKSDQPIDTLMVNHRSDVITSYETNRVATTLVQDSLAHFDMLKLADPLKPGDSMKFNFEVKSISNTVFQKNSMVEENGTFITSHMFAPGLGYSPNKLSMAHPSDSSALQNMYRSNSADFIDFEATVSTSEDQIAIAPGYLQKEWIEGGRRYFKYESTSKTTNDYVFNSGRYQVARDTWSDGKNEVDLEIYHHPFHTYNLDKMMKGLKAGLSYNSENFAPYHHKQARIIEFSRSLGNYGQSYANTLPLSELSFVADTRNTEEGTIDKLFSGVAHEIAHQWWGHQAIPAGTQGYAMVTESMSEYVALKVIEHEYGEDMLHSFIKNSMKTYLKQKARMNKTESPLVVNKGQAEGHVAYQKGALALYALSDYIGEEKLNAAIKEYLQAVRFKQAPYTTSLELLNYLKEATPDSLRYLVSDLFEKVTLYDNKVTDTKSTDLGNGKYRVDIEFQVSKYRSGEQGKRIFNEEGQQPLTDEETKSLPLADYVEVGLFGYDANGNEENVYLKKHKVSAINNKVSIVIDHKPTEVGIDPYNKLIDADMEDNRMAL